MWRYSQSIDFRHWSYGDQSFIESGDGQRLIVYDTAGPWGMGPADREHLQALIEAIFKAKKVSHYKGPA